MSDAVTPIELLQAEVRPEWIDYNGHMNVGYYVVAFDAGADELMDRAGLHAEYRARTRGTIYVVEAHIRYLLELKVAERYRLSAQLVDVDEKRLHCLEFMHRASDGELVATYETMMLHVVQGDAGPASAPFPSEVRTRLDALVKEQGGLAPHTDASRAIAIRRKP